MVTPPQAGSHDGGGGRRDPLLLSVIDTTYPVTWDERVELAEALLAAGVPREVLLAHARTFAEVGQPRQGIYDAAFDFAVAAQALAGAYPDLVASCTVRTFAGYFHVVPRRGVREHVRQVFSTWQGAPHGWLAYAAGLSVEEYKRTQPDVEGLLTLAGLRGQSVPAALLD